MVRKIILTGLFLFVCFSFKANAQITAQEAVLQMGRGINLGNTLDAPNEGDWGTSAREYYFDRYKDAGFKTVRIPVTWDTHFGTTSPYTIDPDFLDRVDTIISWALERDMFVVLNAHHEDWLKNNYTAQKVRFDSLWSQISVRFKDKSQNLFFEMINEPHGTITKAQVDELNARVLQIIRKTNPTRIVLFSGSGYSNASDLMAAVIPNTNDEYLMGYYHSYDPWDFAGNGIGIWGSASDIKAMGDRMTTVQTWSANNNIPVLIGEFGAVNYCDYNSRMRYYATYTELALAHGFAFTVWDDDGWFQALVRKDSVWNDLKDILIHTTAQSPNNVLAKIEKSSKDTAIVVAWTNRATDCDTIFVQKRINDSEFLTIAKLPADSSKYIDTIFEINNYYYYRLIASYNDSVDLYSYPSMVYVAPFIKAPFKGSPIDIPGTVQAENFDFGGEGQSYHDLTEENYGNSRYRIGESVDINARTAGGYLVSYIEKGEWLEYTINVLEAGEYEIKSYVATMTSGGKFNFEFPDQVSSEVVANNSGSWETTGIVSTIVTLPAGEQIMRVNILALPAFNIDKYIIQKPSSISIVEKNKLFVYPNPTQDILFINTADISEKSKVEIVSITGTVVLTTLVGEAQKGINIESLPAGYYMVTIDSDNFTYTNNFIKK
jgi:aryl-phospho-beta-D-glucosidase BglC (GH1 family)